MTHSIHPETMSGLAKLYFEWSAYFKSPWSGHMLPEAVKELYIPDGIRLLSGHASGESLRLVLEAPANQTPQWICGRLKGRLNHHLRPISADFPGFDRSFLLQSIGQNDRSIVSNYIQSQVDRSDLVDPLYRKRMNELRFHSEEDSRASTSHRGRYDLVVHLVLVIANRHRIFSREERKVFDALLGGAEAMKCVVFDASIMPDHAHMMVSWPSGIIAQEILEGLKVESGKILKQLFYWQDGGYVGTVGPYRLSVAMDKNRRLGW